MIGFLTGVFPEMFGTRVSGEPSTWVRKELGGHDGKRRDGELLR